MTHADKLAKILLSITSHFETLDDAAVTSMIGENLAAKFAEARKTLADYNASKVGDDELVKRVRQYIEYLSGDPEPLFAWRKQSQKSAIPMMNEIISRLQSPTTKDRDMTKTTDKLAPVQGLSQGIPWEMHLRAYAAYCIKFSPQPALIDLEGRNCRGGFCTGELDEFVPNWRDELKEINNDQY